MDRNEFWESISTFSNEQIEIYDEFISSECRSSTIFPVYKTQYIRTTIEFLAYWPLKHNNNVIARLTYRSLDGEVVSLEYCKVVKCAAQTLNVSDKFNANDHGFCGSVEVEIFSQSIPKFTYPALTLSFVGPLGASCVHSGIRRYNVDERPSIDSLSLPQTGFDILIDNGFENYICFVGGEQAKYTITLCLAEGCYEEYFDLVIDNDRPFSTHVIKLEDIIKYI